MKSQTQTQTAAASVVAKQTEITDLKAKLENLENEAAQELDSALKSLPGQFGFEDAKAFMNAFASANGIRVAKGGSTDRKPRTAISDEKRAAIVTDLKAGMSGVDVATKHEVSLASVQNIKKDAGLVKARKADSPDSADSSDAGSSGDSADSSTES